MWGSYLQEFFDFEKKYFSSDFCLRDFFGGAAKGGNEGKKFFIEKSFIFGYTLAKKRVGNPIFWEFFDFDKKYEKKIGRRKVGTTNVGTTERGNEGTTELILPWPHSKTCFFLNFYL